MSKQDALPASVDVVVVGGGNAGFSAAHAARERGRRVLLLEKAPLDAHGGNSFYTAGAVRTAHGGLDDLAPILAEPPRPRTHLAPYPPEEFAADLARVTEGRNDPVLTEAVVGRSRETVGWLAEQGIRWRLMYERQSYEGPDGFVFWGGLALGTVDGGQGLVAQHLQRARELGTDVRFGEAVVGLLQDGSGAVTGVRVRAQDGAEAEVRAESVVLCAGGFESSAERRAEYLGEAWRRAVVRGTPTNTGEGLDLAIGAGAARGGDWSSCHSVAWDVAGPRDGGDRTLTNRLTRQSYPVGIVVNRDGRRFVDEGYDFRNYTYARYGGEILRQPDGYAVQLFDATLRPLLRPQEYDAPGVTEAVGNTLAEVATALGVDPKGLERTVREFNAAVDRDTPFDPAVKDGRAARGITPEKSNWAMPIEAPPFYGYAVTCGITFTFGGVRVDGDGRVLREDGDTIPGLFAAGEMAGGLFAGNYPGGSGLIAGAVIGRAAGSLA